MFTHQVQEFLLFTNNFDDNLTSDSVDIAPKEACEQNTRKSESNLGGQQSIVSKFPGIVDSAAEYIKQNGFAAQCRRRTETGYSAGVSISQIREHLYQKIPELKLHKVSLTTIRRLFEAPNKHFLVLAADIKV